MLNLLGAKRFVVIGGGAAGWFAALTLRRMFGPPVEVMVIESPTADIVGVGEGGLPNLVQALRRNGIPLDDFVRETRATFKWGFAYEGWRGGGQKDVYYHLFAGPGAEETDWSDNGFYPLFAAMIAGDKPLHAHVPAFSAIRGMASQWEARRVLAGGKSGISASFHFDGSRLAYYLKRMAIARGVTHKLANVHDLVCDERGRVLFLVTEAGIIDLDFLIDASGLARQGIGRKLNMPWRSFSRYLPVDRAIPFPMPHPGAEPALVTRAVAMKAGWMWQIPVQERIGAGYVFSSAHIDETQAVDEIQARLGPAIQPLKTLRFEPGHFERVWVGNVMALGLASGVADPLGGASIGQMLEQLRNFERILTDSHAVVTQQAIDGFNEANARSWSGIGDFLRMHYDVPRRDTAFWRDAATAPMPPSYQELKQTFKQRVPRQLDMQGYAINGWDEMFHVVDWLFVALSLGLVPKEAAIRDLMLLPAQARQRVATYLRREAAALQ